MKDAPSIIDLREIALREPVGLGPSTWGWYLLFAALALLGTWLAVGAIRRRRANRYRREALVRLVSIGDVAALAVLVKRVCLTAFPRAEVARLSGEPWLRFLDGTTAGEPFTTGPGRLLADHYGREAEASPELRETVRAWIRRHRARA